MTQPDIERTLRDEHEAVCRDARIPSAGAVYWRATIRARAEAARAVDQPMTIAAGVAMAAIAGGLAAALGVLWKLFAVGRPLASTLEARGFSRAADQWMQWVETGAGSWLTLVLCAAALLVISPLALAAFGSRTRFGRPPD